MVVVLSHLLLPDGTGIWRRIYDQRPKLVKRKSISWLCNSISHMYQELTLIIGQCTRIGNQSQPCIGMNQWLFGTEQTLVEALASPFRAPPQPRPPLASPLFPSDLLLASVQLGRPPGRMSHSTEWKQRPTIFHFSQVRVRPTKEVAPLERKVWKYSQRVF